MAYYPIVVQEATGALVKDVDGNLFIDFLSGAAVNNVGHCHPEVVKAIKKQATRLIHFGLLYGYYEIALRLAKELVDLAPGAFKKRVSFQTSGTLACDCAFKLARWYTKRWRTLSFLGGVQGTGIGGMSTSGANAKMIRGYGPTIPGIVHVPYAYCYRCPFRQSYPECGLYCVEYMEDTVFKTIAPPDEVASMIVEPIQGDAGIVVPPDGFLPRLKRVCESHGILFIADEVQTGFGRTGKMFAVEHWGIEPDILVLGKPIASGMPLSAIVSKAEIMSWRPPADVYTLAANPVCCAASLAMINVLKKEKLIENSQHMGEYVLKRLNEMKDSHELIGDVRGKGLMIGVELVKDQQTKKPAPKEAHKTCLRAWKKGLILTYFGMGTLRVAPPLTINQEQTDKALDIINEALEEVEKGQVPDSEIEQWTGWW
jgi:4-aminobutyrate aminotransferase